MNILTHLAISLCAAHGVASDFSSAAAGFSIEKPAREWELVTKPGPHGIASLSLQPPLKGGAVKFSIELSTASALDIEQQRANRDLLLEQIEGLDGIHDAVSLDFQIAGLDAPGLQIEQDSAGTTYLLRQAYLVSQGLQYKCQFYAPKQEFDSYEALFDKALASFTVVQLNGEARREAQLVALAAKCGSEVEWLTDWNQAAQRAKSEGRLIVVAVQSVTGFDIGDQIARGPFMNLDVLRLLHERFVVLRWRKGMGAPFERQDVFGLGPSTFGSGLLIVTSEGEVQQQAFLIEANAVYDILLDSLGDSMRDHSAPLAPEDSSEQEQVQFLLRSGQLERADALLKKRDSSADPLRRAWLRAELCRLRRDDLGALGALDEALELWSASSERDVAVRSRLRLDRANILASSGAASESEETLDRLLSSESELPTDVFTEACLLKGSLRLQAMDRPAAVRAWTPLVEDHPDSRWAWMVAAAMTGPGWDYEIFPNLQWPPAEQRRLALLPEPAQRTSRDVSQADMIESAAAYLIDAQQSDGSWWSPADYASLAVLRDDYAMAATAIGGRALLRLEERPEAQAAAHKALAWLLRRRALLEQSDSLPVVFMDYAVWSRSYGVFFLADCLDAGVGDESVVRELMGKYIADLVVRQQANGGWSYYLSGTAGGEALPQAISFTTATVVMALERALQVDAGLAGDVLSRGLDCLEALRGPAQTFGYFLHGENVAQGRRTGASVKGAAARGPACALALLRGSREDGREMKSRIELYLEHLPAFGDQRRKALMHAGLDGQGSHYLLYDYSTAAEARRELGRKGLSRSLRKRLKLDLLEQLRACRNVDGSYVDNPLIGVDTATGLALSCLLDLVD